MEDDIESEGFSLIDDGEDDFDFDDPFADRILSDDDLLEDEADEIEPKKKGKRSRE